MVISTQRSRPTPLSIEIFHTTNRVRSTGFLIKLKSPKRTVRRLSSLPSDYGETWGLVVNEANSRAASRPWSACLRMRRNLIGDLWTLQPLFSIGRFKSPADSSDCEKRKGFGCTDSGKRNGQNTISMSQSDRSRTIFKSQNEIVSVCIQKLDDRSKPPRQLS